MQRLIRIHAIKNRATALRLSIKDLCAAACPPVPDSTISRWLAGSGSGGPRMHVYEEFCRRLETTLDQLERAELQRLTQLVAPAAMPPAAE